MTGHPAFGTLADLADGRLAGFRARVPSAHAAACAPCGEALRWLGDARGILAAGAAAEPPRSALRRAFRIPLAARTAAAAEAVRTFVARLVFDSLAAAPSPALALRGGAPRHMVFEAGTWDLEISRVEDSLRGSLVPRDETGGAGAPASGTAALYRGRRRVGEAFLDARGRFSLAGVPAGRYELRLEAEGSVVLVPDLDL